MICSADLRHTNNYLPFSQQALGIDFYSHGQNQCTVRKRRCHASGFKRVAHPE